MLAWNLFDELNASQITQQRNDQMKKVYTVLAYPTKMQQIYPTCFVYNNREQKFAVIQCSLSYTGQGNVPSSLKKYRCTDTSDRMLGMIWFRQTEARLFILWLFFRYDCLPNWKYAAAKIHMHFLEGTFKEAIFFSIFTCRALVRNRTLMISCLCNVLFTGLQHDTTLDSLSALYHEISLKNIHTYIQTWPEPVFHRLLDSSFAPSALSLRLN